MKSTHTPRKKKTLKVVAAKPSNRRVLIHESGRLRLMSRFERLRCGPTVAAIEWLEKHADGFERVALLIKTADHQNHRRAVDPDAAQNCAVALSMLREEFRALRARLWP